MRDAYFFRGVRVTVPSFSFDGHHWNETDVYIQNDDSNIIRKIKKSRGPYNDRYSQTIAVKNSKKERLEVFLIFP